MIAQTHVDQGKRLVKNLSNAKWALGDLSFKVAKPGDPQERDKLAEWAEKIDLTYDQVREYRKVAATYPPDKRRADVSWTAHRHLMQADNPIKVLHQRKHWNATTVGVYFGNQSAIGKEQVAIRNPLEPEHVSAGQSSDSLATSRNVTDHERIAIAREVMRDEAGAKEVLRDLGARVNAVSAGAEVSSEEHHARKVQHAVDYPDEVVEQAEDVERTKNLRLGLEFGEFISHAQRDLLNASERWTEIRRHSDVRVNEDIVTQLAHIINAAQALSEAIKGGKSTDEALDAILRGGLA